ncbi:MAG: HPr family phosphocarrier protein, partial [Gammaproteobacteria bacterium]
HGPGALADVIPAPAQLVPGRGAFLVNERTVVWLPRDPGAGESARYFADLVRRTHPGWLTAIAGSPGRTERPAIVFDLERAPPGASPESYEIRVTPRRVVVSAGDRRGLFYGGVTLWQLCTAGMGAPATGAQSARRITLPALHIPALHIIDAPRFRWRGLMLDSARHFQSPEFVMRYIDWMALHKLNVLGWHLTDDQGWRLEVKKYPRLTEVGAWRVPAGRAAARDIDPATGRPRLYGGYYSQDEVRRIVSFAASRNVTIVPEIEMPGHASAAIVAYPQLGVMSDPPPAVPSDWGVFTNLFNVEESTFAFLEDVLAEVMELFPGQFIHVGGDEAVKDQWQASARVHERMRELGVASEDALQGYFTHRVGEYLRAHGRRLVGWDEILEGGVPPDAAVMSWRGVQGAIAAAAAGHDAVLSPDPTLYLDSRQGRSPSEPPGRGTVETLADVYHFDPLPGPLAGDQAHVLGLQGNLWTEHVRTEERAAYMTWPRAAALAEVGWSPPGRLDWSDFTLRLPAEFRRLKSLGVHYSDDVFAPPRSVGPHDRHMSQDLKTCTGKLVLSLEDDAPIEGARAVFLETDGGGRAGAVQFPDRQGHRGDQARPAAHGRRRARGAPRLLRRRSGRGAAARAGGRQRRRDRAPPGVGAGCARSARPVFPLHPAHPRSHVGDRLGAALAMTAVRTVRLLAPLAGWSTPLEEAPDEVFARGLLGDGVAIDPTSARLCAPCDGELIVIAAARHAVTLDSVELGGQGFELHAPQGARVRAGEPLLSLDLDLLARRAKSVLTPVIVTADSGFRIVRRSSDCELAVGNFLMEVASQAAEVPAPTAPGDAATVRRLRVDFEHGIYTRPAALLAGSLRSLAADVRIAAHGREANARSIVALMALGVERGEEIEIRATGPDATVAVQALAAVLAGTLS